MLQLAALLVLTIGGVLEVAGVAFWGLDLWIGLCFGAAMVIGALSTIRGRSAPWGMLAFGLGALALGLHVCLNLGWL
jgi:hypothetical protein